MRVLKVLIIAILLFVLWIFKPVILSYFNSDTQTIHDEFIPLSTHEDNAEYSSNYEKNLYKHKASNKSISQKRTSHFKGFTCDGREHCSQMNSYEEAKYFLKHCPRVKMDGDHDGIPCERQFGIYQ